MGIRLSYRKKNIESEERCLGKLFSYLEKDTDADSCKCISYLVSIGAIDQLLDEFDDLKEYGKNEKFEVICCISSYQDYGEFFELTKVQAKEFIRLYAEDWNRVWKKDGWDENELEKEFAFMDRMSSCDSSIFEFRLGA